MKTIVTIFILLIAANHSFGQEEYPIKPSEEHSRLKAMVGVWDAEIEMTTPDGTTSSTGVETVKMLGELWLVSDFTYEFMGQPTHGHGTQGFDPSTGKYTGTWIESASPYVSTMEGEYNAEKKSIIYAMKSKDPEGNPVEYKVIDTQVDANHKTFQLQAKMEDDQFATILKISYTKRDQ